MASKRYLLAIDDDPEILNYLTMTIASPEWEIVTATNEVNALDTARKLRPFVIITDLRMPVFGMGRDFIYSVFADKSLAGTPVIVITSMDLDRVRDRLPNDERRIAIMNKPPQADQIFETIRAMTGVDGRARADRSRS